MSASFVLEDAKCCCSVLYCQGCKSLGNFWETWEYTGMNGNELEFVKFVGSPMSGNFCQKTESNSQHNLG